MPPPPSTFSPIERAPGGAREGLAQTARLAEIGLSFAELIHELRQPLSTISGYAQLVSPQSSPKEVGESIAEILKQCGRMEGMLARMRRFLRPDEADAAHGAKAIDAEATIRSAIALLPKMPPAVRLELQIAGPLGEVLAEEVPLEQIIVNLVGNARDAQREKGPGTVLLRAERSSDGVTLLVADEGVGISPEIEACLFRPFATTKGQEGTGLGLYICRELLSAWGGTIELVSPAPSPYSTAFKVSLRVPDSPSPRATNALASLREELAGRLASPPPPPRALIVASDESTRRLLRVLLAAEQGLELHDAADGPEALGLLGSTAVQVIVVRQKLAGMNGLELARRAAELADAPEVVVLAPAPSDELVVGATEHAAFAVVAEPVVDANAFRACVRAAAERAHTRRVVSRLGTELRPWAARALHLAPRDDRELCEALELLANPTQGAGRIGILGSPALVSPLALAGLRVEGPWDVARALTAVAGREVDVIASGPETPLAESADFVRKASTAPWGPAFLRVEASGSEALSRAALRHRREMRTKALAVVLKRLEIR